MWKDAEISTLSCRRNVQLRQNAMVHLWNLKCWRQNKFSKKTETREFKDNTRNEVQYFFEWSKWKII